MIVLLPLKPGFPGNIDDVEATALRRIMDYQLRCIVKDGGNALCELLEKEGIDPANHLSFHGLRKCSLFSGKFVTEEIYIHGKCLIADDKVALIGTGAQPHISV